jgi:hypothetical protein
MADISGVSIGFFVRKSGNGELNGIEPYFDAASFDLSGWPLATVEIEWTVYFLTKSAFPSWQCLIGILPCPDALRRSRSPLVELVNVWSECHFGQQKAWKINVFPG